MFKVIKNNLLKSLGMLILVNFINVQFAAAQAPNCEECDDLMETDPVGYLECVEENCGTGVPIDTEIWVLILGGLGIGGYYLYRYNGIPKTADV